MPPAPVLNGYVVRRQQTPPLGIPSLACNQPSDPQYRLGYVGTQEATYKACPAPTALRRQPATHRLLCPFTRFLSPAPRLRHHPRPGSSSLSANLDFAVCPAYRSSRAPEKGGATTRAAQPTISPSASPSPALCSSSYGARPHLSTPQLPLLCLGWDEPRVNHHQPRWPESNSSRFTPR